MNRKQLEVRGYRFNVTPYGYMVEWLEPVIDPDADPNDPDYIPKYADVRKVIHGTNRSLMYSHYVADHLNDPNEWLKIFEKEAIAKANADWVSRRIRA